MRGTRRSWRARTTKVIVASAAVMLVAVALPVLRQPTPASAQTVTRVEYVSTPEYDYVHSVEVDGSAMYVGGITDGSFDGFTNQGGYDGFVREYGATGAEWTVQFGSDGDEEVVGLAVDAADQVYVAGFTSGALPGFTNLGSWDAFVQKYSSDGALVWSRQFGTDDFDQAYALAVTSAGDVYVAGYTYGGFPGFDPDPGSYSDAFLRAYDTDGTERWTRQFGTEYAHDEIDGVAVDPVAGTVVVAGYTQGAFDGFLNAGQEDVFIRTYSSSGVEGWTEQFGTAGADYGRDVAVGVAGEIHVAAQTDGAFDGFTPGGGYDGVVRTYSATGVEGWTQQFGTSYSEYVQAIAVDGDGASYVVSTVQDSVSWFSVGSLRTFTSDGTPTWTYELTSSNDWAGVTDVATDGSGNAYIGGSADGALPGTTDPNPANGDGVLVVVREVQVTAPVVTLDPQDVTVTTGDTATFTAAASGEPTPTVQWEESTDGSTWVPMTDETSTTLSFTADLGMDGYEYRAVFTNTSSVTTDAATLTVNPIAPFVTLDPINATVYDGNTATFTAAASGVPTPTVQWEESTDGTTWAPMAGETFTTLDFVATLDMNGNQYQAVFTNTGGSVTTTAATLTVNPAPTSAVTIESATIAKGSITVVFTASGTPLPTRFECNLGKRGAWVPCESAVPIKKSAKSVTVRGSADGGATWVSDTEDVVRVR